MRAKAYGVVSVYFYCTHRHKTRAEAVRCGRKLERLARKRVNSGARFDEKRDVIRD